MKTKACRKCNIIYSLDNFRHRGKYVSHICKSCEAKAFKRWNTNNKDKKKARNARYTIKHRDELNAKKKDYYKKTRDNKRREYIQRPDVRSREYERTALWKKKNPEKVNAINAKRRAEKLKRLPKWADIKAIRDFYVNKPRGHEVDHFIPLVGKNVSGLHIVSNLQYLTKKQHASKLNKFDFEEYKKTEHYKKWLEHLRSIDFTSGIFPWKC